jgi:hypothetical protein
MDDFAPYLCFSLHNLFVFLQTAAASAIESIAREAGKSPIANLASKAI